MSDHKFNPLARGNALELPATVRDQFGRVLKEGDRILLVTPQVPQLYLVKSIAPNIDPKFPENQMVLTLTAAQRFLATRDAANPEFVKVIDADEQPPARTEPPKSSVVES